MRYRRFYEEQSMRQKGFPSDRIAFRQKDISADCDIEDFSAYQDGKIDLETLRYRIAWNNYLETYFKDGKIPKKMLVTELRVLGYARGDE